MGIYSFAGRRTGSVSLQIISSVELVVGVLAMASGRTKSRVCHVFSPRGCMGWLAGAGLTSYTRHHNGGADLGKRRAVLF